MSKYQVKKISVTEMPPFFSPKLREAVSTVSYMPERDCNKNPNGVQYLRENITNSKRSCFRLLPVVDTAEGVRVNVISSKKQQPNSLRRDTHAPRLSLSSGNAQGDGFGRHFRFDPRWENGIYSNTHQHSKDEDLFFKRTTLLPPVPNPACSINTKESHFTASKSCTLVSEDRCRLNAVSSVPAPARSISKNRRMKSRMCHLSTLKLTTRGQSYADPVLGASASFIRRLLEMSTLQEKTVRQEKIIQLKKNGRHEP
ncbi:uncharacterized protein si:ch211-171b20.3 [Ictalurus furcatus]|uniref:uncharacterized protein si:ch211-171b20.3 n=1 Tax=Ictalurus furcatus TaxID=66913 RepID=UPI0023508430|nr:uncharacterized protein si:ch211-171b20.3 [Ictalurus furcatus]